MTKWALALMATIVAAGVLGATFWDHSEAKDLHRAFNPCPVGFHFKSGFCLPQG